ncbi:MAG TPA: sialate O-acetylesterase [Tepidisphaeraceae bacterium]
MARRLTTTAGAATRLFLIAGAMAMLLGSVARAGTHYDLYLLAGQSNMDGRGKAADLKPEKREIPGAIIFYRNPPAASDGWKPLTPGYSVAPGYKGPLPSPTFGPEIGFAIEMRKDRPDHPIALIKGSKGGTSLAHDWKPGEAGEPESQGPCYRNFIETIHLAGKDLEARGDTYTLRGILWHQGESDDKATADQYQQMLTTFIARVRGDLGQPELPFVIGEVYDNGKRGPVRAAQRATAKAVPHVAFIPADGTKTWDNGTHFDADSQLTIGARFADSMAKLIGT